MKWKKNWWWINEKINIDSEETNNQPTNYLISQVYLVIVNFIFLLSLSLSLLFNPVTDRNRFIFGNQTHTKQKKNKWIINVSQITVKKIHIFLVFFSWNKMWKKYHFFLFLSATIFVFFSSSELILWSSLLDGRTKNEWKKSHFQWENLHIFFCFCLLFTSTVNICQRRIWIQKKNFKKSMKNFK